MGPATDQFGIRGIQMRYTFEKHRLLHTVVVSCLLAISTHTVFAAGPLPPDFVAPHDLTIAPPALPVESPTVVTFYENEDLTGASFSVEVMPTSSFEATRVVTTDEINTANLYRKISSVRLACGMRPSRVSLFDIDWSEFSDGTILECDPNQTVTMNLATQTGGTGQGRDLNNKLGAAAIVAHVRSSDDKVHYNNFSFLFSQGWKSELSSMENASSEWTRMWLEGSHAFHIEQALTIDHWACTARDAVFDLRITMGTYNFRPVFKVYILSEWVSYGFGDGWPTYCHKNYLSELHSKLLSSISKIESQIPEKLFEGTSSATYYFAPDGTTRSFQAFYWH
jgi:hypothetical protein